MITGQKLFSNKFVGWGLDGSRPKGRSGDTHHPPNALDAYQYNQTIPFDSDINDWKPDGGTKSSYSNSVPLGVKYNTPLINQYLIPSLDYNKDGQYTWLVYWFQTIPGLNNNIDYKIAKNFKEQRRLEYKRSTATGVYIIDDYAHHPTEINAVHQAVRELYPNKKIIACFQPHLFSRTKDFVDGFASSLSQSKD